ncbi:hypothetical protein BGAL_0373g00160 [Botrytis galanthina]|uniref:Uncharacterized protein n=1 Tax=Botrytis galanthina TaxID=278940 RepID=A0A4S8QPJ0_9HELO|nr:hypothetical protein BGAL_0373g00160 [Botrytis galanthina]
MELDTSDVGSEIQELEEPELEEPELEEQELEEPELEELYESAEPPRERNRGIDDSMNEADIEKQMQRFENNEKEFVENYIKPLIDLLREQPMIKCVPENKEIMELYERRHELEEMIQSFEEDPNVMEHGQAFLNFFHDRVWQEHFIRVRENIDSCEDDIQEIEKLKVDLRIMLVNSGIILRGRGLPMRRIDDSGNAIED